MTVWYDRSNQFKRSVTTKAGHHIVILLSGVGKPIIYADTDPNYLLGLENYRRSAWRVEEFAVGTKLVIWDVQHGSAAYIRTPSGKNVVIDLGVGSFVKPDDATFSPLRHLRQRYGVDRLDTLVITHPHTDHIEDIGHLSLFPLGLGRTPGPAVLVAPRHLTEDQIRGGNPEVGRVIH